MRRLAAILAGLPPLTLLVLVVGWSVDVPFMDDWALVDDLVRWQAGTESLDDLFRGHDVHRILVPRLVMLALADISGWDLRWQMVLSVLLASCLAVALIWARRPRDGPGAGVDWAWAVAVSLIVFNLNQWENWCWGWQVQVVLAVTAVVTALILLDRVAHTTAGAVAAVLLGAIASYSFASALVVWLAAAPILVVDNGARWRRAAIWVVGAGATIGSYLIGFRLGSAPIGDHPVGVLDLVAYVFAFLGAPVAGFHPAPSIAAGAAATVALALGLAWMTTAGKELARQAALWTSLALVAAGGATLAASGRASLGLGQALSSRYVTISNLLWLAVVAVGLEWWRRQRNSHRWQRVGVAVTAALLALALVTVEVARVPKMRRVFAALERARAGLVVGDFDRAGQLFPSREKLERSAATLRELELSCFRPALGAPIPTGSPVGN